MARQAHQIEQAVDFRRHRGGAMRHGKPVHRPLQDDAHRLARVE